MHLGMGVQRWIGSPIHSVWKNPMQMKRNGPWVHTSTIIMQGIFKRTHRQILGQVMDLNCFTWIFNLVLAKQLHFGQSHPPIPPHLSLVAPFARSTMVVRGRGGGGGYNRTSTSLTIMGSRMPRDIYGCGRGNWRFGGARTWWHLSIFCIAITGHAFNLECWGCSIIPT
jgi:hypothetical protein